MITAKNQEKKDEKKIPLTKKDLKKKELEELEKVLAELGCKYNVHNHFINRFIYVSK